MDPVQHYHGQEQCPQQRSWDTSPTLDEQLNESHDSSQDTMSKTPKKDAATQPPVFLTRAEDSFQRLPPKKQKSGRVIVDKVLKQIEEDLVETGKIDWMRRARALGSRPGGIILPTNVAKHDPYAKHNLYLGSEQELSGTSAKGVSSETSRWPSVRETRRRKHIPIPGPHQRMPRKLTVVSEEQRPTNGSQSRIPMLRSSTSAPPLESPTLSEPASPPYNAFSPTGYWATEGHKAPSIADDAEGERHKCHAEATTHSDSDAHSEASTIVASRRKRAVVNGPIAKRPMVRSHTTPGAFFTEATRPPPETIPALEPNRESTSTDSTIEEKPFDPVDFLERLGVFPGRPSDNCCPFPEVEDLPKNHDVQEAYAQIRSVLVGFWYSHVRAKQEDEAMKEQERDEMKKAAETRRQIELLKRAGDHEQWVPSLPRRKSTASRPTLKTKPSVFKTFLHGGAAKAEDGSRRCSQGSHRRSMSTCSDVTILHVEPELKPKNSCKDLSMLQATKSCTDLTREIEEEEAERRRRKSLMTTAREALAIAQVVLRQLQQEFIPPRILIRPISDPEPKPKGTKKKAKSIVTLDEYMLKLPELVADNFDSVLLDEKACFKTYTIRTMDQLRHRAYWHIRLSPRDWVDPDFIDDPEEYQFETILHKQMRGLQMLRRRRAGAAGECRVTQSAMRIVWATKFVEEMERLCERRRSELIEGLPIAETDKANAKNLAFGYASQQEPGGLPDPDVTPTASIHPLFRADNSSDDDSTPVPYPEFVRAVQAHSQPQTPIQTHFHFQSEDFYDRVAESLEPEASPPAPPPKDEEGESARLMKLRRRKTTFNMGLMYGDLEEDEA